MEEKDLLPKVYELFLRYGIKSLTMDDISRSLSISKKTLYKFVSDKADLVSKAMEFTCEMDRSCTTSILQNFDNAIEELVEITKFVSKMFRQMHPSVHYDLQKYYPEAWQKMENLKTNYHYKVIRKNLELGIEQELYRKNINTHIIARLYIEKMDIVFNSEAFPTTEYRFDEIFVEHMRYHIHGIASDKGRTYLKQLMQKDNLNLI